MLIFLVEVVTIGYNQICSKTLSIIFLVSKLWGEFDVGDLNLKS